MKKIILALIAAALVGCGGGGGGDDGGPEVVPTWPGTPDPSYGEAGSVTFPSSFDYHSGLAVDSAGNAYLAGASILKLNASGRVATSYGDAGRVPITAFSPLVDEAGNVYAISGDIRLIKVDASGRVVPSFGDFALASGVTSLVRAGDGGFYAIGTTNEGPSVARIIVKKFDREGHVDLTYGANGTRVVDSGGANQFTNAAAVDRQGNLYVAASTDHDRDMLVVKLDPNGNLMADFGVGGRWQSHGCDDSQGATAIAVDGENVYVAGGCSSVFPQAVIWKLDSHGVPVMTFGTGGMRATVFGRQPSGTIPSSSIWALLVDAAGNVYAAGKMDIFYQCGRAAVVKLDANGRTVESFANAGVFDVDAINSISQNLAMDPAGRLYVAVSVTGVCPVQRPVPPSFRVVRLLP